MFLPDGSKLFPESLVLRPVSVEQYNWLMSWRVLLWKRSLLLEKLYITNNFLTLEKAVTLLLWHYFNKYTKVM